MNIRFFILLLLPFFFIFTANAQEPSLSGEVTLRECLQYALQHSPQLKPYTFELLAQEGLVEQAGLPPNPELELEAENLLGTGQFQGADSVEATVLIRQLLERGNKRSLRVHAALTEKRLVQDEWELARINVLYDTADAFLNLLAAQEQLSLQEEFFQVAQKIYEAIRFRVEAGRSTPVEEIRARVLVASTKIELDRSLRELEQARLALAKTWGSSIPQFTRAVGNLLPLPASPDLPALLPQLAANPELRAASTAVAQRQVALRQEEAEAIPDITVGAGVRYLSENEDGAFVLGFSLPLPWRNRNQGAIRAARERIGRAQAEYDASEAELQNDLHTIFQDLLQAGEESSRIQQEILPAAEQAFAAAQEGYRQGKFSYLDVLDAQRSFFELKVQAVGAAQHFHLAFNQIHRLVAQEVPNEFQERSP